MARPPTPFPSVVRRLHRIVACPIATRSSPASLSRPTQGFTLAAFWHLLFGAAIVGIATGLRPSRRLSGALLTAPLGSVSAVAFWFHNPFNGVVLATLAAALLILALGRGSRAPASAGPRWMQLAGAGLLAFGWLYPHFLVERPALAYLIAAPLGLIPCPTLSAVIGVALFARGFDDRAWSISLALVAGGYGLFGVARLGVWIDLILLVGAASLLLVAVRRPPP